MILWLKDFIRGEIPFYRILDEDYANAEANTLASALAWDILGEVFFER